MKEPIKIEVVQGVAPQNENQKSEPAPQKLSDILSPSKVYEYRVVVAVVILTIALATLALSRFFEINVLNNIWYWFGLAGFVIIFLVNWHLKRIQIDAFKTAAKIIIILSVSMLIFNLMLPKKLFDRNGESSVYYHPVDYKAYFNIKLDPDEPDKKIFDERDGKELIKLSRDTDKFILAKIKQNLPSNWKWPWNWGKEKLSDETKRAIEDGYYSQVREIIILTTADIKTPEERQKVITLLSKKVCFLAKSRQYTNRYEAEYQSWRERLGFERALVKYEAQWGPAKKVELTEAGKLVEIGSVKSGDRIKYLSNAEFLFKYEKGNGKFKSAIIEPYGARFSRGDMVGDQTPVWFSRLKQKATVYSWIIKNR